MYNMGFPGQRKAKSTRLAGKVKCGRCGAGLMYESNPNGKYSYFRCRKRADAKRQSLTKAIADMRVSTISPENMKSISGYLINWDYVSFDDRRLVVDGLISRILATSENVQIEWKI